MRPKADEAADRSLPRAERLAKGIQEYWAAKGHQVEAWVVAQVQPTGEYKGYPLYSVRTNLVNGLPRK